MLNYNKTMELEMIITRKQKFEINLSREITKKTDLWFLLGMFPICAKVTRFYLRKQRSRYWFLGIPVYTSKTFKI